MTVIVVRLTDWIVILALILNAICSVHIVLESRRIRKRRITRVEIARDAAFLHGFEPKDEKRVTPHE